MCQKSHEKPLECFEVLFSDALSGPLCIYIYRLDENVCRDKGRGRNGSEKEEGGGGGVRGGIVIIRCFCCVKMY